MRRNPRLLVIIFIALILIVAAWAAFFYRNRPKDLKIGADATDYELVSVNRNNFSETIDATGQVTSSRSDAIYSDYDGSVKNIAVKAGDPVKKGDRLLTLEAPERGEAWLQAESSFQQAERNLSDAEKDLENTRALYQIQGATKEQIEAAQNKVTQTTEALKLAQFRLQEFKEDPEGNVRMDKAKRNIFVLAPYDGRVAWIPVRSGEKVYQEKTQLASIIADNSLIVEATVDENEILQVKTGQKVIVFANDPAGTQIAGKVIEVGGSGTLDQGVTIFPVRIKLAKDYGLLKPAMSVDLTIVVSKYENILAVPVSVVQIRRGREMVLLWKNQAVTFVRVDTGVRIGDSIEITAGLKEGDILAMEKLSKTERNPRAELQESRLEFPGLNNGAKKVKTGKKK